jgi:hypothetical protein
MANIDLSPGTPGNNTGLHVHVPAGTSAAAFNNCSDFPVAAPTAAPTGAGKSVVVNVAGVRFASPS